MEKAVERNSRSRTKGRDLKSKATFIGGRAITSDIFTGEKGEHRKRKKDRQDNVLTKKKGL